MTNQEAINSLKNIIEYWTYKPTEVEAVKLAIEALEKQIPKQPIIKSWSPTKCPTCGIDLSESIGDGYYKHWTNLKICDCGQKLKWN